MAALNDRQLRFARELLRGAKKAEAYRLAYDCSGMSADAVSSSAYRLAKNAEVKRLLEEQRQKLTHEAIMDRAARMRMLSEVARESQQAGDPRACVAAIAELNRMDGACVADAAAAARDDAFREAILRGASEPMVRAT